MIDSVVDSEADGGSVRCPIESCKKPILNTPRYILRTREPAFKLVEEEKKRIQERAPRPLPQRELVSYKTWG